MLRKSVFVLVLVAAVAALTVSVLAGARATLILTSGERVSGILSDMGGSDFTMNAGSPNEIRIPIGEVAVIDFVSGGQGMPATETSKMQAGRTLVVQRDAGTFFGRLADIRGDNPLTLVFSTQDGELELGTNEVARVYLRRWDGMPQPEAPRPERPPPAPTPTPTPAPAPAPAPAPRPNPRSDQTPSPAPDPGSINIPANGGWVSTGIQIRRGQLVAFATSGDVVLSGDATDTAGPSGAYNGRVAGRGAPMPGVAAGALVGKVGQSAPFGIGGQTQALDMPGSGTLLLAVNDDNPGDNRGEFRVKVTVVR